MFRCTVWAVLPIGWELLICKLGLFFRIRDCDDCKELSSFLLKILCLMLKYSKNRNVCSIYIIFAIELTAQITEITTQPTETSWQSLHFVATVWELYIWKRSYQYLCFPSPSYSNGGIHETRLYHHWNVEFFLLCFSNVDTWIIFIYHRLISYSC